MGELLLHLFHLGVFLIGISSVALTGLLFWMTLIRDRQQFLD